MGWRSCCPRQFAGSAPVLLRADGASLFVGAYAERQCVSFAPQPFAINFSELPRKLAAPIRLCAAPQLSFDARQCRLATAIDPSRKISW
jgi:hypothetical protein